MSPAAQLHMPIIGEARRSSVVNGPENQGSFAVNRGSGQLTPDLKDAVAQALVNIRMSDKEAAAAMGIDPGRWSRQKNGADGCFIQLDKLALLPEAFHVEFARLYAERVGLHVSHESIADLLIARVGQLLLECHTLAAQLRRTA